MSWAHVHHREAHSQNCYGDLLFDENGLFRKSKIRAHCQIRIVSPAPLGENGSLENASENISKIQPLTLLVEGVVVFVIYAVQDIMMVFLFLLYLVCLLTAESVVSDA